MTSAAIALLFVLMSASAQPSPDTEICLDCHREVHPGIVGDWERSRHRLIRPSEALEKEDLERRVSAGVIPEALGGNAVGCAECHTMNPDEHADTFEHNGYQVHIVVTPEDCSTCHPEERDQYRENIMSKAYGNLTANPVYMDLAEQVNGVLVPSGAKGRLRVEGPDSSTEAVSCLSCHGTRVSVTETVTRETDFGDMEIPLLAGWPNQGVGRVNPDGSLGACTSCHTRHAFSIETARKPHTCSQCHKGPDVPGYKVYEVSKHGNLYASMKEGWDMDAVPWVPGRDFSAPTCAACHASLCATEDGRTIARRTHRMNDRLAWRLFGVYAHPHPRSPDTTLIRNRAGLPLPADLDGTPASGFLLDRAERKERRGNMKAVCLSCHGSAWVETHFARLDRTIETSNQMTLASTGILLQAWDRGLARGLDQGDSIFNEWIEKLWVEQWLFHANSTRYASAMMGADYGVFESGRWHMARTVREMEAWIQGVEK